MCRSCRRFLPVDMFTEDGGCVECGEGPKGPKGPKSPRVPVKTLTNQPAQKRKIPIPAFKSCERCNNKRLRSVFPAQSEVCLPCIRDRDNDEVTRTASLKKSATGLGPAPRPTVLETQNLSTATGIDFREALLTYRARYLEHTTKMTT